MNTPIRDFVKRYADSNTVRFHMPGHKGIDFLGIEKYDITEISGADVLYDAKGIIKESEENASELFGSFKTYFSTEGSSLCIKAMLALAMFESKCIERKYILAGRNAHKAFIYACALLDIDVEWLLTENSEHICSCDLTADDVRKSLESSESLPFAVYITSPDYLGHMLDIKAIADVCNEFEIPLLVDNAHGAYLHFLENPAHPIDLGAFMCCDSAHKTLPVLTGGAYLHLSHKARMLADLAENTLSIFASTSPSYLILQSLDMCNSYLNDNYTSKLKERVNALIELKNNIMKLNYSVENSEPLKLVLNSKESKISSEKFIRYLNSLNIEVEFYDDDFIVFMFTCENAENDLKLLFKAFKSYERESCSFEAKCDYRLKIGKKMMSIRNAVFSQKELIPVESSVGKICACPTVSCPPAIPVVVSGELITEQSVEVMKKYGIKQIEVVI